MWIDLLKVLGTSVASIVALFLLAKLMGNKQISQLSMFDYIVGITIGSIAAEMATDLESPLRSLLAMVVYGLLAFFISVLTSKSLRARRVITGRPILLMSDGKIYRDNLKRARLDLTEFLALCRVSGYFDLSAISVAIMECSGTLSFCPSPRGGRLSRRISVCTRGRSRCRPTWYSTGLSCVKTSKPSGMTRPGCARSCGSAVFAATGSCCWSRATSRGT